MIDDVDAAAETNPSVHHRELAVQSPQPRGSELERPKFGAVHQQLHTRIQKLPALVFRKQSRPEAVYHEVHQHPAPRRAHQRRGDALPGVVGLENVGLQVNLACCGIDLALERREVLLDVAQQPDPVPAPEFHAFRVSSADSAM